MSGQTDENWMKTYPEFNNAGEMTAFEISNIYFPSSGSVSRFFARCPGVQIEQQRRPFEVGNEVHTAFKFEGTTFVVWEPYGDSSRFWIGPQKEVAVDSIKNLHTFVATHWPGPISRLVGQVTAWFL